MRMVVRPDMSRLQRLHDPRGGGLVEPGHRLVEDEHRGVAQDRPGEGDALALAAGERAGRVARGACRTPVAACRRSRARRPCPPPGSMSSSWRPGGHRRCCRAPFRRRAGVSCCRTVMFSRSDWRVMSRMSTPSSRMRPAAGIVEPQQELGEGGLARAARPGAHESSPGSATNDRCRSVGLDLSGIGEADVDRTRPGRWPRVAGERRRRGR